jgi:hypothetical protein
MPALEGFKDGTNIFIEFIDHINKNRLRVLEIGSRLVSPGPGGESKRKLFPEAQCYVGFDYYRDSNTNITGDCHRLSQYFGGQRFDAIFSVAVLEHLAMPWVVAIEIVKLLEINGVTFHCVPQSWPLHETPWDFWRFSEESLRVLFSPAIGFEVIETGYFEPVHMKEFPSQLGFGGVAIYAKKVREPDFSRFKWDVTIEELLGSNCVYPEPKQKA